MQRYDKLIEASCAIFKPYLGLKMRAFCLHHFLLLTHFRAPQIDDALPLTFHGTNESIRKLIKGQNRVLRLLFCCHVTKKAEKFKIVFIIDILMHVALLLQDPVHSYMPVSAGLAACSVDFVPCRSCS